MVRISGLILGILLAAQAVVAAAPAFNGFVRLPVELYSGATTHLEPGQYTVEVKQDNGEYLLLFEQNHKTEGSIKGVVLKGAIDNDDLDLPLIGTQYLRSSADPIGSEAERHFSKSGLPHYQEENRDWKATLRAYTSTGQKETLWFFEERQPDGSWSHIKFTLSLSPQ